MIIEHSEQLDKLATDLSQLQGELTHVSKDSKGYGYNYSSLSDTLDTVKPLLKKYGFSITQFEDGTDNLVTMLLHKSGQYLKGRMKLINLSMKSANEAQAKGAVLSYFRRYSIQAILGMAAEDSDGAEKKEAAPISRPTPAAKPAAPELKAEGDVTKTLSASTPAATGSRSFRQAKQQTGDI